MVDRIVVVVVLLVVDVVTVRGGWLVGANLMRRKWLAVACLCSE